MQAYHSFVPSYPPPAIPTRESIIAEGLKALDQSKTDQQWLKFWLERKMEQKKSTSKLMTLSEYRQKLGDHARLLRQYKDALHNSNHGVLSELKQQIEQSNHLIYNPELIKSIQVNIRRRKSKRARLRRRKEDQVATDTIETFPTNEKSLEQKIQDIELLLQTIAKVKQSNRDEDILDELSELGTRCTTKLHEYQTELAKQCHCMDVDLYNSLFNNHDRSFYESMNSDAHDFLRAHQNVNDLVEIRQAWDRYSTPHFSSVDNLIPLKWYEPQPPSDANWSLYTK
ncbi:unnamed protein product [Adineta ricciae]|uniref:Uncharacterized protein n=1 Tax=Adineta ricciae TaxID=249248 RepID=A0A815L0G9_ADIRI|nr:unnamed protein product [Adineta ricciae]CAF1641823.1 unnamed protein product [Adineta ricciae]